MTIKMTKKQRVKEHLLAGRVLTGLQLLNEFGCLAYRDVIYNLRKQGVPISSIMVGETKHAVYFVKQQDLDDYLEREHLIPDTNKKGA